MSNANPRQVVPGSDPSHAFSKVAQADIQRSKFNLSHEHKTTIDAGYLYPLFNFEVIPGDTFDAKVTGVVQMLSLLQQLMDSLYMDLHWWFVPNRLTWTNWERMNGQRTDPSQSIDITMPLLTPPVAGFTQGSYADYMGYPLGVASANFTEKPTANYLRSLNLIYNTWYRDQNLIDSVTVNTDDGPDAYTDYPLLRRGKRKDYFTGALPWPQKGDSVLLPLGDTAPVVSTGLLQLGSIGGASRDIRMEPIANQYVSYSGATAGAITAMEYKSGLEVDMASATSVTINALRLAIATQQLLERDARGGTRYVEIVLSHFGVISPDARLQRPEYLGGGTVGINVSPVAQTFTNAEVAAGDLGAVATGLGSAGFQKSFTEHGWVLGLVSVRAEQNYQNGIEKMWNRRTRYDHYWPALAHLGEQGIQTREIFAVGDVVADDAIWGYQERYAEYRYKPSRITGLMASNATVSLDYWHLAVDYGDVVPPLNGYFLAENPPIERVIAVTNQPHFILDMWFDLKCQRPMPVYSVPGMVDHF